MNKKVTNPNEKSNKGFIIAIIAVVAIVAVVIAYIVINGQGAKTAAVADREYTNVSAEMDYDGETITFGNKDNAAHVELYEDFSCPYCAELAEATDDEMLQEIEADNLAVTMRPMHFLDNQPGGHSTKALAALLALAERGETEPFWNLREFMMENQQDIYNSWDESDLADAAKELKASDEAVESIRNGEFMDKADEVGSANEEDLSSKVGDVSSPRVLMDGSDIEVEDLNDWVSAAVESGKN